jgi:hypothetical protein
VELQVKRAYVNSWHLIELYSGGEKYLVNNIFFKFALDIYHLYGGTEFAMKAGTIL